MKEEVIYNDYFRNMNMIAKAAVKPTLYKKEFKNIKVKFDIRCKTGFSRSI